MSRYIPLLFLLSLAACGGSTAPGDGGDETPAFAGNYTLTFTPASTCQLPGAAFTAPVVVSQRALGSSIYQFLATPPGGEDTVQITFQTIGADIGGNLFLVRHTLPSGLRITAFTTLAGQLRTHSTTETTAQGEIELDTADGEARGHCNGMHPFTLTPR